MSTKNFDFPAMLECEKANGHMAQLPWSANDIGEVKDATGASVALCYENGHNGSDKAIARHIVQAVNAEAALRSALEDFVSRCDCAVLPLGVRCCRPRCHQCDARELLEATK